MMPLAGQKVLALGTMATRPLATFLESLGADVLPGGPDDASQDFSFVIDDLGVAAL
jgi:hypothetical protein